MSRGSALQVARPIFFATLIIIAAYIPLFAFERVEAKLFTPMAYAIGYISGCHLNPAVSVGLVVGKRFPASDLLAYVVAQVIGARLALQFCT